ncbi:hypothetical protein [Actinokineospora iranica]|uniref:hypothetical protein n=1 Tax=Actinokineospora iranica TaxID=1271860 RepID=UPI0015878A92|nr:hypothetical protein [Actinokineospora iranica]
MAIRVSRLTICAFEKAAPEIAAAGERFLGRDSAVVDAIGDRHTQGQKLGHVDLLTVC